MAGDVVNTAGPSYLLGAPLDPSLRGKEEQVREYEETTPDAKHDEERMKKAYIAVLTGTNMKLAARHYNIAYTSLRRRVLQDGDSVNAEAAEVKRVKQETMTKAYQAVLAGMTMKEAAQEYKVPYSSLRWRMVNDDTKPKEIMQERMDNAYEAVLAGMKMKHAAQKHNVGYSTLRRRVIKGREALDQLCDDATEMHDVEQEMNEACEVVLGGTSTGQATQHNVAYSTLRRRFLEGDNNAKLVKQERMDKAYNDVLAGMNIRQAAQKHNVAYTSLRLRVVKVKNGPVGNGREPWLSREMEERITEWCVAMSKMRSPLLQELLPEVVKSSLDAKKINLFPPDNLPPRCWVEGFLGRCVLSVPETLGSLKVDVEAEDITEFFVMLEQFLNDEHDIDAQTFLSVQNASRVFSCAEAMFFLNAANDCSKVVVRKGLKDADEHDRESTVKKINVLSCVSADGVMYRPLIMNQGNPDTNHTVWMTTSVFNSWLVDLFHTELQEKNIQKPVVLLVDGHSSHMSIETVNFAKKNGIIMFCLPPNALHLTQPLDVSVYTPVEAAYKDMVSQSREMLTKGYLPKKYFPYVLMQAFKNCNMKVNIKDGFKRTGLLPYNPSTITSAAVSREIDSGTEEIGEQAESNTALRNAYTQGYEAARIDGLERLEALLHQDMKMVYEERLQGDEAENCGLLYKAWKELKEMSPSSLNPFKSLPSTRREQPTKRIKTESSTRERKSKRN